MKTALIVLCFAAAVLAGQYSADWAAYVAKYELTYSAEEYQFRESVYETNLIRAAKLQLENPLAEMGETIFSHLTQEEFASAYLGSNLDFDLFDIPQTNFSSQTLPASGAPNPTTYDWSAAGVISAVKDQGQCGSCWAFSATETIESYWYLAGKSKVILSPEQIVDCDKGDDGCQGGFPSRAYNYVKSAGGLDTEESYPYHAGTTKKAGTCAFKANSIGAKITGYTAINGETGIYRQASNYGPVSICVDASSWNAYRSGTLTSCGNSVDHCVQLTGYSDYPKGYWNVRNSWGTGWGEAGYIHLAIGKDLCALGSSPTVVQV